MSQLFSDSIFWIEVDKIHPNPYQPRREFDEHALRDLSDSIRQYGILQPLTVSRVEIPLGDGGLRVEYELIAGERRLRASKLAGVVQVPCVIRVGDDPKMKLELAIIENLQREDLNAVERARAFQQLYTEFGLTHAQIGQKMGKSREYVSNTLRLLSLPPEILDALSQGKISEGHTRPLMMLVSRPEEQLVLFKEILFKKITVREAERIARKIASDKIRKKEYAPDPELMKLETELQEALGTRVHIDRRENGGQIVIDFFSNEDLRTILDMVKSDSTPSEKVNMLERFAQKFNQTKPIVDTLTPSVFVPTEQELPPVAEPVVAPRDPLLDVFRPELPAHDNIAPNEQLVVQSTELPFAAESVEDAYHEEESAALLDDRSKDELVQSEEDADLYSVNSFTI